MLGKMLYLSVIGRPILYGVLFILKVINFIKLFSLVLMIRNGIIKIPPTEPKLLLTETEYIEKEINIFKKWCGYVAETNDVFSETNDKENKTKCIKKQNDNMDDIFYKLKEYNELMLSQNYLEKKWRNRTLITSTPQGNIIMYYDCYKRGFSYYSDQTNISYALLNVIAMKYVKMFLCIDLFIDNKIIKNKNRL
jgi:hypothetical protein